MSGTQDLLIFGLETYAYLRDRMVILTGASPGHVESKIFPDGERYLRITSEVSGRDVVLVGGTISDADTLALYDLASGLVSYGARTLTLVIPYFGYATMERVGKAREIVTAKTRAQLFSCIAPAGSGNTALLLDLHAEGIAHYFEQGLRAVHVRARSVVLQAIKRLGGDNFVLACTDAGRAKWVESLANALGVDAALVFKRRLDARNTEVAALSGQVTGRRVVIYDDMIRTGSSLIQAAQAYRNAGAIDIAAVATHGVFPKGAWDSIAESNLFSEIVCTDSHPNVLHIQSPLLRVESVADIFAEYLLQQRRF